MRLLSTFTAIVIVSISLALSSSGYAATLGTPTDVAFTATYDGSTQRYVQLLPTDYDPAKQYDVMIALHGYGSDRWQYATATAWPGCFATRDVAASHDMILICPEYRGNSWMGPAAEADMLQIIQNLKGQYHVGKMILTGGSMGGSGALTFTALHPTLVVDNAVALEYVVQRAKGIDTDLHPITINTSFEYQKLGPGTTVMGNVSGWTMAGSNIGVVNLTPANYALKFDDPAPDGSQMAVSTGSVMYQFLGTTVRPGTYHLSLKVGSPKDNASIGTFLTGFLVANNNVAAAGDLAWGDAQASTTGPGLVAGKWSSISLDWSVAPNSPALGKYLYLDLASTGSNATYFDNVSVTFTPIPEPGTFALVATGLLLGLLAYAWRTRGGTC